MINLQPTNKPGTDKIIYVMQSDVDQNLFIYIGKTFAMKDGTWTYGKYEMGDVTPLQLKNDLAKNGWHEVSASKAPARVIDGELPDAEEKGEEANDATVNEPENPMADSGEKVEGKKLADDLFEIAGNLTNWFKNMGKDSATVEDELIQSSSKEALQKNIETEIEAGKDPKQAAAIAYSVQRENDAAGEWVRGPRGTFKVVEGTEEDLRKEGYGFHHGFDANGKHYSVMVKNNEAVAVEDNSSVKDAIPTVVKKVHTLTPNYIALEDPKGRFLVIQKSKYRGEKEYNGGGTVEFSLDNAKKTATSFETIESLEKKYGRKEGYERWMRGETDSAIKDAPNFKKGDKVRISENFHIERLQGVKGIVTSVYEDGMDIKELEGPRKGEEHFWYFGNDIIKDSSINDGHGILSSGQEATLRKYCDKYEVEFDRAYKEIERQLKRYPGKKVDDLIEGLLDDMVTGIFDCDLKDSKEGFENYLEVYDSDMKDSRIMDSDQTDILNEIKSKYPFVKFENMHFEKGSDAASKGYKMDYFTFDITGQLPSNLERFDHTVKQPFERFVEWVMKKRGYRPTVFSEARGGSLKVKVGGMKVYKATDSAESLKDAELKVGGVHHDRYGNKYTIKRVQYPGDSKRGNEQGIVDVYVEKKSGPSHNAFFEIDKFKRMIVDSQSVRDSITVGGKYRWEKKFGNLPLELRHIDEFVLLAAGNEMTAVEIEEFKKLLEKGEIQNIGEGSLPEYNGIKTDYKVKVGDRNFIVKAQSKEDARNKVLKALENENK